VLYFPVYVRLFRVEAAVREALKAQAEQHTKEKQEHERLQLVQLQQLARQQYQLLPRTPTTPGSLRTSTVMSDQESPAPLSQQSFFGARNPSF
jgi:hypothetical protein